MSNQDERAADKKSLIGPQEVVAIGLGAVALLRIRRRRRREAAERADAERAEQEGTAQDRPDADSAN